MAVLVNVDNLTDIAHRVGQVIGDINLTLYVAIVKVIAYKLMVLALTVRMDCGDWRVNIHAGGDVSVNVEKEVDTAHLATSGFGGKTVKKVVSWRATKDVLHSVYRPMDRVLHVVTVPGETVVSWRATKDVLHSVYSQMDRVHRVVMGSGETVVSRRAQTVYQVNVISQMKSVCRAMMDIGATIVPRRAVKVAHYRHVISLTGHVHLAIMDTGGSHATFCAATGALTSVHSLMHIVRRV